MVNDEQKYCDTAELLEEGVNWSFTKLGNCILRMSKMSWQLKKVKMILKFSIGEYPHTDSKAVKQMNVCLTSFLFFFVFMQVVLISSLQALTIQRVEADALEFGQYEKIELDVEIEGLDVTNPYNAEEVRVKAIFGSPQGKEWTIPGFWDGRSWRVRFAANEIGTWQYQVVVLNNNATAKSKWQVFRVLPSSQPGWLEICNSDPSYFCHDNGKGFFGVGQAGTSDRQFPAGYMDKKMVDMSNHGLNVLSVWWGPSYPLESEGKFTENTGVGVYDQSQAEFIDAMVETAEQNGIVLIPMIWTHNQFYNRHLYSWSDKNKARRNPYRKLHNGTLTSREWSTDRTSLRYQHQLYRYIIARWGYSTSIGIWGIFCELNLAHIGRKQDWLDKTALWFKKNDPYDHPLTVSYSGDIWKPNLSSFINTYDYHAYDQFSSISQHLKQLKNVCNKTQSLKKPVFLGEYGILDPEKRFEYVLETNWVGSLNGLSMTPLYWWTAKDKHSFPRGSLTWKRYLNQQKSLAGFVSGIPFGEVPFRQLKIGEDVSITRFSKSSPKPEAGPTSVSIEAVGDWDHKYLKTPLVAVSGQKDFADNRLPRFLHGGLHRNYRVPVYLVGNFSPLGKIRMHIEGYSKAGASLQISDGQEVILKKKYPRIEEQEDHFVSYPETLEVQIKPGLQIIWLENRGRDWIRIKGIEARNVLPLSGAQLANARLVMDTSMVGLKGSQAAYAFISKRANLQGKNLFFRKLENGFYQIKWWDVGEGKFAVTERAKIEKEKLVVEMPNLPDHIAFKIEKIN